jgi:hypothetical protein
MGATVTRYLLIEARDPCRSGAFGLRCELAAALHSDGAEVTLFLVENAVLGARAAARNLSLDKLAKRGVALCADEFALHERGIGTGEIAPVVKPADLSALAALLAAGARAIWN